MDLSKMSLNLFCCHFPFSSTPPNSVPLSSLLSSPPFPPLPSSLSLPSLQHTTEMYGKLHSAFRKVVDIMATGKRYFATYFRVAFFGKVGHATSRPSEYLNSLFKNYYNHLLF